MTGKRGMLLALLLGALVGGMWYSTKLLPQLAKGVQVTRQACGPTAPEKFDGFLKRFQVERSFANARTTDPLQVLVIDPGQEDEPVPNLVPRSQYSDQEMMAEFIAKNGMSVHAKPEADKVELLVYKEGTDWQYAYRFRLQAGCWQLWQTETVAY